MLKYQITTPPTVEPITLTEAKLNLRVDCDADDDLITALIVAARQWCEDYENRAYITQTITMALDWLPRRIILPKPKLQLVTSVKYIDDAGDQQTLSSDEYDVDIIREPGQIVRSFNGTYPSVRNQVNAVEIIFVAGYGAAASDVPQKTKQAIYLLVTHWYENRIAVSEIDMKVVPLGAKALLNDRMWTV